MNNQLTWQAEEVLNAVHSHSLHEQTWKAHGVSIDSRTVKAGDLFVALKGPVHDGHDHVAAAFAAGAVASIVARQPQGVSTHHPLVMVEDTFVALNELGRAGRARTKARIIAITGSVGKTGTKEMMRLMLGATGSTYATEGSLNNHWGVPLSLARMPAQASYGVFELGMNHAGEMTKLTMQVLPQVSLITTIEAVHLEFFDSLEGIADAKAEIFLGISQDGAAVLNRDNLQFARLAAAAKARGIKKILSFGHDSKCDARLVKCSPSQGGSNISASILGRKINYHLAVPGEHLALNSVGALLAAAAVGSDAEACAAALSHYKQPKGRGVIQSATLPGGAITIIDESYNASPSSVRFAARVLGQMKPGTGGRKILVLGDMLELGATAASLHAELAADIVESGVDMVFCCGPMMQHLYDALPPAGRGLHADNSAELMPYVLKAVRAGDVVTVKGSHSLRMDIIVHGLRGLENVSANNARQTDG